jgi:hypothetical protein
MGGPVHAIRWPRAAHAPRLAPETLSDSSWLSPDAGVLLEVEGNNRRFPSRSTPATARTSPNHRHPDLGAHTYLLDHQLGNSDGRRI